MSVVRLISDLHLGHLNIAHKRGFKDVEEHDEHIISKWNETVSKRDLTYLLGDVSMETSKHYHKLARLEGRIHVILGNHDRGQDIPELLKYVDRVSGPLKYKGYFLSHIPVHPNELEYRVKKNIHGHLHGNIVTVSNAKYEDKRYVNVCCEQIDYTPKTLKELGL